MHAINDSIVAIYDAAMNPACWDEALDRSVAAVDARSATLIAQHSADSNLLDFARMSEIFRLVPDKVAHYQASFVRYEISGWHNLALKPPLTLLTDKDSWPLADEVLREREDYAYLWKHAGIFRKVAARLNDFSTWNDNIAFQYCKSQTTIPKSSMTAVQQLLPHFARAVELGRTFTLLKHQFNAVLSALDHIVVGVCVVGADGQVIAKNEEAHRILSSGDGLHLDMSGNLVAKTDEESAWLSTAIKRCAGTAIGQGELHESSLIIKRRSTVEPLIVEVAPMRDTLSELSSNFAGTVVFLIDPGAIPLPSMNALSVSYGLTAAETSVCELLVDGYSTAEIADSRSVGAETIKTQISQVLTKTRTRSRTELIRLAFRCTPPVRTANLAAGMA